MKIQETEDTFTIQPESKEEAALFKLVLSICHKYSKKDMDQIQRDYEKLEHCNHHYGLGTGKGAANYKCGLPLGHKGEHCYMITWSDDDGMYVLDPRK